MATLKLPGEFNSYPKGPKPPSYVPTAQRVIEAMAKAAAPAQRQISEPAQPARSPKHKPSAPVVTDADPYGSYYFALEINDGSASYEVAHFLECSGLKNASEMFVINEGGMNGHVHKRPGQSKWENITLKFATSASTFLLEWRDKFLQDDFGQRTRYSGSIAIMNNAGSVVRRYHFTNAWPVSWEGPSLSGAGSDLAIESLEIAHDGLKIDTKAWTAKSETTR